MWGEALELLERAERLQRQFFQPGRLGSRGRCPSWEPPIDIFETDGELVILAALPGVIAEQLEVIVEGSALLIRGQRAMPLTCKSATIRRLEIPYGRFERRIELPSTQFREWQQLLKDGCLFLTLTKFERSEALP